VVVERSIGGSDNPRSDGTARNGWWSADRQVRFGDAGRFARDSDERRSDGPERRPPGRLITDEHSDNTRMSLRQPRIFHTFSRRSLLAAVVHLTSAAWLNPMRARKQNRAKQKATI